MKRMRRGRKGQVVAEYVLILLLIVGVFVSMFHILTKAVSGRWRSTADSIGFGMQYEPGKTFVSR